jgi:4-hydroxybenzoate polyprenyltransferase
MRTLRRVINFAEDDDPRPHLRGRVTAPWRALLACASCRFAALYFIPFCAGMALAGHVEPWYLAAGAVYWIAHAIAIELTNRLTDRAEDEVNRPERTLLCETVGWSRLARLERALWTGVIGAGLAVAALRLDPTLAFALGTGWLAGAGYSRGPRFSRNRVLMLVVLLGTFVGPFFVGWLIGDAPAGGRAWHRIAQAVPLWCCVCLLIGSLAGAKDITDRDGDEAVGYRSPFVAMVERHGALAHLMLVAAPAAAVAVAVGAHLLPARMLVLAAFLPISVLVVLAIRGARAAADRLVVREAVYDYWAGYVAVALLAFRPSPFMLGAVLSSWLYWIVTSRHLHWGRALRPADVVRLGKIARRGARGRLDAPTLSRQHEEGAWQAP